MKLRDRILAFLYPETETERRIAELRNSIGKDGEQTTAEFHEQIAEQLRVVDRKVDRLQETIEDYAAQVRMNERVTHEREG